VLAQRAWDFGSGDPALPAVLLPFIWGVRESRVLQPVTALPFVVGVVALLAARARRRKHG
jgi:hypothetical protein